MTGDSFTARSNRFYRLFGPAACLVCVLGFLLVYPTGLSDRLQNIQSLMTAALLGLAVLGGAALWRAGFGAGETARGLDVEKRRAKAFETLIVLLLTAGIVLRIGYMLYTPVTLRQHDLGDISLSSNGHAAYILQLMQGRLPATNNIQFYHPPFFHLLAAVVCRVYGTLFGITEPAAILEAAKIVSCCASILTLVFARKLCTVLRLREGGTLAVISLAAFLPNHYLLAGRVNNDALSILFLTAAMYYTIVWYREQRAGTTLKLALCYGLGMMTKLSVAVFAPVTAVVFLLVLLRRLRAKTAGPLWGQFAGFAVLAFPLGLWYPIRNFKLFGQPLTYVFPIDKTDGLYCGNHTLWARFGPLLSKSAYNYPYDDYNVWNYLVRGSVFGEFQFSAGNLLPALLLLANFAVIVLSLIAFFRLLAAKDRRIVLPLAFWSMLMGSFLSFNVQYPFGCTMDFRYIVPCALVGALFLGMACDTPAPAGRLAARLHRGFCGVTAVCIGVFCILGIVFYCTATAP